MTLALLVTLTTLSVTRGASTALLTHWLMLALLCALTPLHIHSAARQAVPPRGITHTTLLAGLGLCAVAVEA